VDVVGDGDDWLVAGLRKSASGTRPHGESKYL